VTKFSSRDGQLVVARRDNQGWLLLGAARGVSEVPGVSGSSLGKSGGGYSPMLGVRACR
jgi:hypothetical protein